MSPDEAVANCLMCDKPIRWFDGPYNEWLHENRSIYCAGKASRATPDESSVE